MLENLDSEYFKAELQTTKEAAEFVLEALESAGLDTLVPENIPVNAISDFVDGKRDTIWEITVNNMVVVQVVANKRVAKAMLEAVKDQGGDHFPLVPIPANSFLGVVQGKRKNLMSIELMHLAPNAELPGHV